MKIAVLNGSPKGEVSVTMQYVKYLQKHIPAQELRIVNISQDIGAIERQGERFDEIIRIIGESDGILWAFPVYVFLVPSQLKRFIELIFERSVESAFEHKYATILTSSAHAFDHTAHRYVSEISEVLGMRCIEGLSLEMNDLLNLEKRENLIRFFKDFLSYMEEKQPVEKRFPIFKTEMTEFKPGDIAGRPKKESRRILLFTDADDKDTNLMKMIDVFVKLIPNQVKMLNINDIDIKGGCLGCCRCAEKNICCYKDGFVQAFNENFLESDGIVSALKIKDRFFSSRWKMFTDRCFFNNHRPILQGKHTAFIVSGPFRQIPNLRDFLEGHTMAGRMNLMGIVTDEYDDSAHIVSLLDRLGKRLLWGIRENYQIPEMFPGKGLHLLFRDLVYNLGAFFKSDLKFYREHNLLDYPQRDLKKRMHNSIFSFMLAVPSIREVIYRESKHKMIEPLQKVVEEA